MNNVSLIGRLTADPELKHTQSGVAVTRFNIAVDRAYTKQGEERQADFISIIAWRQTAEFVCKYFSKGQRIALTGRIQTGSYTDQNGSKRYTFDVVAEGVEFCEPKKSASLDVSPSDNDSGAKSGGNDNGSGNGYVSGTNVYMEMPSDDDLPF